MEGSTNISGGIKQLIAGTDNAITATVIRNTGWFYFTGSQTNDWVNRESLRFKVVGQTYAFASIGFGSFDFTPSYSGESGFRIVRQRNGIITVIAQTHYSFTAGQYAYLQQGYTTTISSYVDVIPNDVIRIQYKHQYSQFLIGFDVQTGRDVNPTTTISFGQNTIVTTTL